jgi:hypothetical protein
VYSLLISAVAMTLMTAAAQSVVLTVNPQASGRFGFAGTGIISNGAKGMVGFYIANPATLQISATGALCLVPDFACTSQFIVPDPNGIVMTDANAGGANVLPLEERDLELGIITVDPDPSLNVGALIGAFVPGLPGAVGFDNDQGGDIPSSALFLIGAGPSFFTASAPGTLFLGINDGFAENNVASDGVVANFLLPGYTVTIDEVTLTDVPEPSTLTLLGFFTLLLGWRSAQSEAKGGTHPVSPRRVG